MYWIVIRFMPAPYSTTLPKTFRNKVKVARHTMEPCLWIVMKKCFPLQPQFDVTLSTDSHIHENRFGNKKNTTVNLPTETRCTIGRFKVVYHSRKCMKILGFLPKGRGGGGGTLKLFFLQGCHVAWGHVTTLGAFEFAFWSARSFAELPWKWVPNLH